MAVPLTVSGVERFRRVGCIVIANLIVTDEEYNKAVIRTRIQEIDDALVQLATVKAPYPGTVKRLKWQGQDDRLLTVELTVDVDSPTGRSSPLSR